MHGRYKKAEGQNFLQAGQLVWMNRRLEVTCVNQRKKPFGKVLKDSLFPDMWVDVDAWNKEEIVDADLKYKGMKRRAKCPQRLR